MRRGWLGLLRQYVVNISIRWVWLGRFGLVGLVWFGRFGLVGLVW